MMRIVITGAKGLLGWHAHARLHAKNCQAKFLGTPLPYDIVALDHACFADDMVLQSALKNADAVLHFAGVNRASDDELENVNPKIARRLVNACGAIGNEPHIVYANSIHADRDTAYGRGKRRAGEVLASFTDRYSNLILPHIFGECAKPNYNNVTATLIAQIIDEMPLSINREGNVNLLHAGVAAQIAIDTAKFDKTGDLAPSGQAMTISDLSEKLLQFHSLYTGNVIPDITNPFDLALFNSYRAATYPSRWPKKLNIHEDDRGMLFEAVKGGGGGQSFVSTTKHGVTRGDHFHLEKVERFLVLQGEAIIRVRKVLSDSVWEYRVSGNNPTPVDMPTLHTHSIENIGEAPLTTLFWTHAVYDPSNSDTYADKVLYG